MLNSPSFREPLVGEVRELQCLTYFYFESLQLTELVSMRLCSIRKYMLQTSIQETFCRILCVYIYVLQMTPLETFCKHSLTALVLLSPSAT